LATATLLSAAPPREEGRPVVRNFLPRDFEAHNQVFTLCESADGLFYFGVYGNVLEFDGRTWRKIPVPTSWIRALQAMPDGSVYVGATDQIGVCQPGADGRLGFTSLLRLVPERLKPLGPVWSLVEHEGAVWFLASKFVARLRGLELKTWELPAAARGKLHVVRDTLWLRRIGDGLYRWDRATENFVRLAAEPEVINAGFAALIADGADGILVGTETGKFFRLRGEKFERWTAPLADEVARVGLRNMIRRRDGSLAIATIASGVLLAEADGTVRERLTESAHGLVSDVTYELHEDAAAGLWVTTFAGVSRVELGTGLTLFDQRNGRGPTVTFDMVRRAGELYLGANDAVYKLEPATADRPARLARLIRPSILSGDLALHDDQLLVSDNRGVLRIAPDRAAELVLPTATSAAQIVRSRTDPARYFVGTLQGVQTFRIEAGRIVAEGPIAGYEGEAQSALEEPDGTLWLGTTQGGYVRFRRRPGMTTWQDAELVSFLPGTRGVPEDPGWCRVVPGVDGLPLFSTGRGAFVPDARRERLVPAPAFLAAGKAGLYSHPLLAIGEDRIVAQIGPPDALDQLTLGQLLRRDGTWSWQPLPKAITEHAGYLGAYDLHFEATPGTAGVLWVSGRDALVRVDLATALAAAPAAPGALVRRVSQRGVGAWGARAGTTAAPLALSFSREPIEFSFAAPRYDVAARLAYQTRLRGYDDAWSEWSPRGEVAFTNLSGGPFTLEVRARDADGRVGPVAGFRFRVAPPWQRSTPALALYGATLGLAVYGLVRRRLRRAERERTRLERIVTERTAELKIAKDAADEANRAKSAFLANMSHELRTPLNGVIGYAQVLMKDQELSAKNRERLQVVQSSGEHLLRMINEVLDFSKIEAGRMELTPAPFHLPQLLRDIAAAIGGRLEQKQLEFVFEPAPDLPDLVLGDPLKLRQVIDNLLGNALKFTVEGSVRFSAVIADRAAEVVRFSVVDTGVGISARDREKLFQPFQQAADGRPPEPGTGLGLAISQRLVELMGGRLEVDSTPGRGSTFSFAIRLPVLAADAAAERKSAARITGYRGRRRRVLVVDDVATNRHVLRDLLGPLGFEVSEAASGVEALALAPGLQPDLVLLDLRLPGIDGFELARRLRERTRGAGGVTKLIAMSASVLSFNRADAFAAGCDDFLPKPFREDDLLARLGLALQLEWLGEEATAPAGSRAPFSTATQLPPDTIAELLACARRGEIGQLRQRLAALPRDPLVEKLEPLARNYRMERIRELLETLSAPAP
jgi:signal transduction histidine kinase/DNA-binding NarL/FixJ family response regulator